MRGDWFPPVKSLADKFSTIVVRLLAGGDWFQCALALFGAGGVAVPWLAWALGVTLCVFLVHCVWCCAGDSDSACWRELMDDRTSSPYIFLFMLLLIPFVVVGFQH